MAQILHHYIGLIIFLEFEQADWPIANNIIAFNSCLNNTIFPILNHVDHGYMNNL